MTTIFGRNYREIGFTGNVITRVYLVNKLECLLAFEMHLRLHESMFDHIRCSCGSRREKKQATDFFTAFKGANHGHGQSSVEYLWKKKF